MSQGKWQNKANIYIYMRQYVQIEIFETSNLKQVFFIQKLLESIDLSATNGTFVTKGEIESNFLTTRVGGHSP